MARVARNAPLSLIIETLNTLTPPAPPGSICRSILTIAIYLGTCPHCFHFILVLTHFERSRDVPPAHYSLKYNVMPHVGVLTYGEAARTVEPVLFPAQRQLS